MISIQTKHQDIGKFHENCLRFLAKRAKIDDRNLKKEKFDKYLQYYRIEKR